MSSMGYPGPYPMGQGQSFTRIVKRPMTFAERELPANIYKGIQKAVRGLAVVCLVLFVFSTFIFPALVTDPVTLDSFSITLTIFMLVFGAVALGMAVNSIVVRKKVQDAMTDGTVVEVVGPAYRTGGAGKMPSWTIGPISIMPMRGFDSALVEGTSTTVLCVPKLKAAIAINNQPLRQGARIIFPPNLEAMATPTGFDTMPLQGQPPMAGYPVYGQAYAPGPVPPPGYPYEMPPPPPKY